MYEYLLTILWVSDCVIIFRDFVAVRLVAIVIRIFVLLGSLSYINICCVGES